MLDGTLVIEYSLGGAKVRWVVTPASMTISYCRFALKKTARVGSYLLIAAIKRVETQVSFPQRTEPILLSLPNYSANRDSDRCRRSLQYVPFALTVPVVVSIRGPVWHETGLESDAQCSHQTSARPADDATHRDHRSLTSSASTLALLRQ